jgi:hypothetical protein
MKTIICILSLFLITQTSCTAQKTAKDNQKKSLSKQNESVATIELIKSNRGGQVIYKFDPKTISTTQRNRNLVKDLSLDNWEKLNAIVQKINLQNISSYQSDGQNRFNDSAAACKIIIKTDKNSYTSEEFDEGNPPKELSLLYNNLIQIITNNKEK